MARCSGWYARCLHCPKYSKKLIFETPRCIYPGLPRSTRAFFSQCQLQTSASICQHGIWCFVEFTMTVKLSQHASKLRLASNRLSLAQNLNPGRATLYWLQLFHKGDPILRPPSSFVGWHEKRDGKVRWKKTHAHTLHCWQIHQPSCIRRVSSTRPVSDHMVDDASETTAARKKSLICPTPPGTLRGKNSHHTQNVQ